MQTFFFTIKCKNLKQKISLEKKAAKDKLKHIKIETNEPLYELFPRSRLIIGYNSLALVEALLSRAIIAVPQWGEIKGEIEGQQFSPEDELCKRCINFVKTKNDMESLIKNMVYNPYYNIDIEKRESLLKRYWYYAPEETNSKQVEEFIRLYVKSDST
jgi:hypothetical protein